MAVLDTDGLAFCKQDQSPFTEEEQEELAKEINSHFPEKIRWELDETYDRLIVLKTKNYITLQDGKVKKKGSSLRSSKTEKGLSKFMDDIIQILLFSNEHQKDLLVVYNKYIKMVNNLTSIDDWSSKKTVTKSVLEPTRTTEQKILDAIGSTPVDMGSKVYVYFTKDQKLKLREEWSNDHCPVTLMSKLHKTLKIFENVISIDEFPRYHLKNKKIKAQLETLLLEV